MQVDFKKKKIIFRKADLSEYSGVVSVSGDGLAHEVYNYTNISIWVTANTSTELSMYFRRLNLKSMAIIMQI